MALAGHPLPGLDAATAGDPDGRMRLLDRAWPDIDVAQLRIFAIEGKWLGSRPGLDHQVMRFIVLVAQHGGHLAIGEVGIHRRPHRETRHQPPTAHDVEHGELLGHPNGRIIERQAIAEDDQRRARGPTRQRGGDQVRRGHEAVGVAMVLVAADAIEAHLLGVFHLVEKLVIELMPLFGVEEMAGYIHPDAAIFLREVVRQKTVWHQMEPVKVQFHTSCMSSSGWVGAHAKHRRRCPAAQALSKGKPGTAYRLHVGFGFIALDGGQHIRTCFQRAPHDDAIGHTQCLSDIGWVTATAEHDHHRRRRLS